MSRPPSGGDAAGGEAAGGTDLPPGHPAALLPGLRATLEGHPDVVALGLFGSGASGALDAWSDLDVVVVVEPGAVERLWPDLDWLRPLGAPLAWEQSTGPRARTVRLAFTSGARLDAVLTTPEALLDPTSGPWESFWAGCRVLFSRSAAVTQALHDLVGDGGARPPAPATLSEAELEGMANGFWHKAVQAVVKTVRDDRLIALHLALDLLRDCCVLEMLLRDRETGTSVHREGGRGNAFVSRLPGAPAGWPAPAILDLVEACATRFDRLGGEWSAAYSPRAAGLLPTVRRARRTLAERASAYPEAGPARPP